ncbi:LANO_0E11826g1_1 [Lachancea nothofagi CBS 11611]|uniref:LANO_0E11826g1_1 n=1 Tax=Lachancea nothofagi CBS 11611 TaxID=1266666 RepID=A0A1G4JXY0_9SACH|nr:LANO_0E11826g1_1 [Lachancea nothofagi CBS 11611]
MVVIQKNAHINQVAVMQRKPKREYALAILKDIAHQVSLLMRENKFKVGQLVEFYPKNKQLLGMNVNGGAKIMLRLRQPFDEDQFLAREQILGTMLHELTHNLHGPHNAIFYKKLDELMARQWVIEQRGLFDGFIGRGRKLGVQPKAKIPPQRLGGNVLNGGSRLVPGRKSAKEMASEAAEKRAKDAQWCGRSKVDEEPAVQELAFIEIDSECEEVEQRVSSEQVTHNADAGQQNTTQCWSSTAEGPHPDGDNSDAAQEPEVIDLT